MESVSVECPRGYSLLSLGGLLWPIRQANIIHRLEQLSAGGRFGSLRLVSPAPSIHNGVGEELVISGVGLSAMPVQARGYLQSWSPGPGASVLRMSTSLDNDAWTGCQLTHGYYVICPGGVF